MFNVTLDYTNLTLHKKLRKVFQQYKKKRSQRNPGHRYRRAQRSWTIAYERTIHTHTLSPKMTTAKQIATHKHFHEKKQHNMNRTILPRKLNLRKWDIRILQFTIRFFFSRDDDGVGGLKLKQILYTHAKITHTNIASFSFSFCAMLSYIFDEKI